MKQWYQEVRNPICDANRNQVGYYVESDKANSNECFVNVYQLKINMLYNDLKSFMKKWDLWFN